jgi:hypothetical protein
MKKSTSHSGCRPSFFLLWTLLAVLLIPWSALEANTTLKQTVTVLKTTGPLQNQTAQKLSPVTGNIHRSVFIYHNPPTPNAANPQIQTISSGKTLHLAAARWQPHTNGRSKCLVLKDVLCIQSQQAGGAWFTTPRPYGFAQDYTVSFYIKLNTANNHFPVLYSDGFVFVDIDWGTTLGHYQPGLAYNLKQLSSLAINRWYHIRVEAHPAKKSFDLYLDNKLVSTATNIQPLHSYHTLSSVINRKDIIWFGDADALTYQGGSYNHGDLCWTNIQVKLAAPAQAGNSPYVWAINQQELIYRLNSHKGWDHISGKAHDIGVGSHGTVWITGTDNVYGGHSIYRWMETQFVKVPGAAVRVDVGPWGTPWVVNAMGDIYYWKNKVWNHIPGKATDIGVGADGTVWVIGNKAAYGGFGIFRWTGTQFVQTTGAAVRIDVGPDGNPWVVNSFHDIYHWENNGWVKYPGLAYDISVANDGTPWVIGTDNRAGGHSIFYWNKNKRIWAQIPGGATVISVGGMPVNGLKPAPIDFSRAVARPCSSNIDFVRSLYQSILGRDMLLPLQARHGLGHVQALQNGVSRKQIITNFFHSPEYTNKHKPWSAFIVDAYQACLGRNPSAYEVQKWLPTSIDQALRTFFNSREYNNLIAGCSQSPATANPLSLSGTWKLNQDNGYTGIMQIQQSTGNHFFGHVTWNGNMKGNVDGKMVGNVINFTIDYHNGDIGSYKGILSQDKIHISNGTAKGNNGVSAHWNASKVAGPSSINQNNSTFNHNILGQWKWFTGSVVTFYANGTAHDSAGGHGTWTFSNDGTLIINWSNGTYIDRLKLNGNKLSGKNQIGTVVTATRILPKKPAPVVSPHKNAPGVFHKNIVGQWKWFTGGVVTIYSNGKVKGSDGNYGTWTTNGSQNGFIIHWVKNGAIDKVTITGNHITGKNQNGTVVTATRILPKKPAPVVSPHKNVPGIFNKNFVGQWKWFNGTKVNIYPNGVVEGSRGDRGVWTTAGSPNTFSINWNHGQSIDHLQIKEDKLKGSNQNGIKVSAKKIVVNFKSGKYMVEQSIGKIYNSTWKIQVKGHTIKGTSKWDCCPGKRTDPISGYIDGYTVVIQRDCSGQHWNGNCKQKFIGTLMGPKIEGTCTGTGIKGTGHWVLYLK